MGRTQKMEKNKTINIIEDTAVLTTIPEKAIKKLIEKMVYAINEAVVEARIMGEDTLQMDIGLGTLLIKLSNDSIQYKFIPGDKLEESVKNTFINKQNLLEDALDASLVNKLTNIYKDLF
jgi:ribosomal protein L17